MKFRFIQRLVFLILLVNGIGIPGVEGATEKLMALTFDDSPGGDTLHFQSLERTQYLIKTLTEQNVPEVMVFANPCLGKTIETSIAQLKLYREKGHFVANHSCTHLRFDDVGFDAFSADVLQADKLLNSLMDTQKFFRFPYLNEGKEAAMRDQMRQWLIQNNYRHGAVSIDNDDYIFSFKINQAKKLGKKIDYAKIKTLFLDHLIGAADFYEDLAKRSLGRSPKHVMLLHEKDATVLFAEDLVKELRARGWSLISAQEAFKDPIYFEQPKNTYANNGIIAQLAAEKTGKKEGYFVYENFVTELDKILGL